MADETDVAEVTDEGVSASDTGDAPELTEIEQIAADMGWSPKDQWKGDAEAWKPAGTFLKAGREINKSLRDNMKRMERQLEGISRTTAAMTDRAVQSERAKWEAEHDRAVDDGDKAAAKVASKELARLDATPTKPDTTPEGEDFAASNPWFGKDTEATAYAVNRAQHYADQGLSPTRQLAAVKKDMTELFPDLFSADAKPEPRKQPSVGEPQRTARTGAREKGYATLPPEARKACDAWVGDNKHRGAWVTKESWSTQYYDSQEAANG